MSRGLIRKMMNEKVQVDGQGGIGSLDLQYLPLKPRICFDVGQGESCAWINIKNSKQKW